VNPENGHTDEPGVFAYADKQIGALFSELSQRHFFDNGILLISGDHRSMTPLFAAEQAKFGDSAMARVPMVIATNLPIQRGALRGAFQQTDLVSSLDGLASPHACRLDDRGLFLSDPPTPPTYVLRARGDKRDHLDVYFRGTDGTSKEGGILLDGDDSRWLGDKPADWQQIMLRVAEDRIERGGDTENALDFIINLHFPPASPDQRQ
jgi:lipoteichoic acid synthase